MYGPAMDKIPAFLQFWEICLFATCHLSWKLHYKSFNLKRMLHFLQKLWSSFFFWCDFSSLHVTFCPPPPLNIRFYLNTKKNEKNDIRPGISRLRPGTRRPGPRRHIPRHIMAKSFLSGFRIRGCWALCARSILSGRTSPARRIIPWNRMCIWTLRIRTGLGKSWWNCACN